MTTQTEALKLALEALESSRIFVTSREKIKHPEGTDWYDERISAIKEALAQLDPVAMKFKIYKPTVPDPLRQDINHALLPWVYDQDRSSGFDATMWVTPVATLPPQRKPLTDEEIEDCIDSANRGFNGRRRGPSGQQVTTYDDWKHWLARAIEAAHNIKE